RFRCVLRTAIRDFCDYGTARRIAYIVSASGGRLAPLSGDEVPVTKEVRSSERERHDLDSSFSGPRSITAAIASPISVVDAVPPRSAVRGPLANTLSIASRMALCASCAGPVPWPRKSSIRAPDQIIATGLAMLRP